MRMIRSTIALSSTLCLLVACSSAAPTAGESLGSSSDALDGIEPGMKVHWQKDVAASKGGGGSGGALIDHGGRVMPTSNTYAIWWGTPSAFPSDAQAGLDSLFAGMNGTSWLGVGKQYMRGANVATAFHVNLTDTSAPPSRPPSTSSIVSEACKVIGASGLTADPTALYVVYTSNFPGGHTSYCAWHSSGTCNGQTIQVAYIPNTTGMAGCDPGNLYNCNSYSQGTRSLANVTSHEYMEAITDANASAWYDGSGSEIGDKCAWQFASCVSLSSGSWQLQKEWSNSAGGCVQD